MAGLELEIIEETAAAAPGGRVVLRGEWTLSALSETAGGVPALEARLLAQRGAAWDLRGIHRLDSVAALLLWRAWGRIVVGGILYTSPSKVKRSAPSAARMSCARAIRRSRSGDDAERRSSPGIAQAHRRSAPRG